MLEDGGSYHIQNVFDSQRSNGSALVHSSTFLLRVPGATWHMFLPRAIGAFQRWSPQIEGTSIQESRVLDHESPCSIMPRTKVAGSLWNTV